MRILYVITSLKTGGAERLMVDMIPWLKKRGLDVELLTFDGTITPFYEELSKKNITIHSFGKGHIYNPIFIFKLIPFLKQYDIIHTHNTAPQLFTALANLFTRNKLVYTEHSTDNNRRSLWWFKPFDRWCYRQYHKIICISSKAEENLRLYLGGGDSKIITINNGVEINRFSTPTISSELQIAKGNDFIVTMVAGFREQKDQDTLIRAVRKLPENIKLWLVGDGVRRFELERLCEELDIKDRVEFLGIRTDVPSVLKVSDVVVMSSHYEGLSLASVEGMAAGKPMIASDVDGLKQVIEGYGILFPHQNDEALANEVEKLYADSDYYIKVASACRHRAMDFDIEKMVDGYIDVYHSLCPVSQK